MTMLELSEFVNRLADDVEERGTADSFWNLNPVCMTHHHYFNNQQSKDITLNEAAGQLVSDLEKGNAWACKIMAIFLLEFIDIAAIEHDFDAREEAKHFLEAGAKDKDNEEDAIVCSAMLNKLNTEIFE